MSNPVLLKDRELPVCEKCGWHKLLNHRCAVEASQAASGLMHALTGINSTKLGYGDRRVTFDFDEEHSITLEVVDGGRFSVDSLFWLDNMDAATVRHLVLALRDTLRGE